LDNGVVQLAQLRVAGRPTPRDRYLPAAVVAVHVESLRRLAHVAALARDQRDAEPAPVRRKRAPVGRAVAPRRLARLCAEPHRLFLGLDVDRARAQALAHRDGLLVRVEAAPEPPG